MYNGLTFQEMYTLAQRYAKNTSDAEVTSYLKQQINVSIRLLKAEVGSYYNTETRTINTQAGVYSYPLPENFQRLKTLHLTVGSIRYPATIITNDNFWQTLFIEGDNWTSDHLRYVTIKRDSFEIYPPPVSDSLEMTFEYEPIDRDLTADDYTTGTITTLANNTKIVTGSGTTFTPAMVGRFFQVVSDGQWYEIETYTSTTVISLVKNYQGSAISAGSETFRIGQMPKLPGIMHQIPPIYAAMQYYQAYRVDTKMADHYKSLYKEAKQEAFKLNNNPDTSNYSPSKYPQNRHTHLSRNPNWHPQSL